MTARRVTVHDPYPSGDLVLVEGTHPFPEDRMAEVDAWIVENGEGLFFGHADNKSHGLAFWFTDPDTAFWFKMMFC